MRARATSSAVVVAMTLGNVCTYGYQMVAARLLGPSDFGAFAALMGLLLVLGVAQLGLQATAARRISAHPEVADEVARATLGSAWRVGLAIGLLGVVLAPVVTATLHLDSWVTALMVPLAAAPITLTGAQIGVLQGRRQWGALALLYLANGLPRVVIGTVLLVLAPSETTAILGVAIGQLVPITIGAWLTRDPEHHHGSSPALRRELLVELLHNLHVLLAFFVLGNADILVARHGLSTQLAGLYGAGLIVSKVVLFMPQFVVVLAFPDMADQARPGRALRLALATVTALGVLATIATALLPRLALVFIGGDAYSAIAPHLWLFALSGTGLAVVQLLSYAVVARQSRHTVLWIWAGVLAVLAVGQAVSTPTALAVVVLVTDAVLALVLFAAVSAPRRARTGPSRPRRPAAR